MPVLRPRRFLLLLITLPFLFLTLLYIGSPSSRRTLSVFLSTNAPDDTTLPDEIFGLLHFVTAPEEAGRVLRVAGEPEDNAAGSGGGSGWDGALALGGGTVYAGTRPGKGPGEDGRRGWEDRMEVLREQYPVVVFSKVFETSQGAPRELQPLSPPKVIEVDLRADSPHIKTLLTRLTRHSTFPNVILHGRSLGGSDDLVRMHEEGQLKAVLERGGVKVRWTGEGEEGIIV
ncbi:hypothetical protein BU15DRAFT_75945 [Melanogaster broomeanus]|nr:hypothetical protein BU15DRAFT_75945 [Melanogaster broomeanus]